MNYQDFGIVADFDGNYATATDNAAALNAFFAAVGTAHNMAAFWLGGHAVLPKGGIMFKSQLHVPDSVRVIGDGPLSTFLVPHADLPLTDHQIWLGNKNNLASFDTALEGLQVYNHDGDANYGTACVYSNNTQHTGGLRDVKIMGGHRVCVKFETGAGGASYVQLRDVETHNLGAQGGKADQPQIFLNYGSTVIEAKNIVTQGPSDGSAGANSIGISYRGGILNLENYHVEGTATGIEQLVGANSVQTYHHLTGNELTTCVLKIQSSSSALARTKVGQLLRNGAPYAVIDGRPGKSATTTDIIQDVWM